MSVEENSSLTLLRAEQLSAMQQDVELHEISRNWFLRATDHGYTYHFDVLGRPIIQLPQDIIALNEIIWTVRPDVIIETGIAHGGSVINSASQLALLDLADTRAPAPLVPKRKVIAIDIDIRSANRGALEGHFLCPWFELVEGSSTSPDVVGFVQSRIPQGAIVLVLLDSNHTHDHVLQELRAYSPMVSAGSYCVVYDTVIEEMPPGYYADRPWDVGDNAATAVTDFLAESKTFSVDEEICGKLLISVAPRGYLKRV